MAEMVKLSDAKGGPHSVARAHVVDAYCAVDDETLVNYVITAAAAANDLNQPHRIALKDPHAEDFRARLEERV